MESQGYALYHLKDERKARSQNNKYRNSVKGKKVLNTYISASAKAT